MTEPISFKQARFITSAFELHQLLPDEGAEIAFAGRSNAGKSSAINCLTRQKQLCKTSKTPGRTQLINFFSLGSEVYRLVDLPGYGFAKVSKKMRQHWDHVLTNYLLERQCLKALVVVVDIRRGIGELDLALIDLVAGDLPLHILLAKSDKLSRNQVSKVIDTTNRRFPSPDISVSSLSVLNRNGLGDLETRCQELLRL